MFTALEEYWMLVIVFLQLSPWMCLKKGCFLKDVCKHSGGADSATPGYCMSFKKQNPLCPPILAVPRHMAKEYST